MAKQTIQIGSIMNGISQLKYFSPVSRIGKPLPSYHAAIAIDPDMPETDSAKRLSGLIRPTAMAKFSGSTITAPIMWLVSNPKDSNCYAYCTDGTVYAISSALAVTALNSGSPITHGSGAGAEYYDKGLLLASTTDIVRYGNLDGTPSFTMNYWTGTLGKTALANTTYPSINGVEIPNHPMFRHPTSGVCFVGDVNSSNIGAIHQIKTQSGGSDNGSGYNALQLQEGYFPTVIEAYQDTLAVASIEGTSTSVKQKRAALTFWDMTSPSFSKVIQVEFPDPFITAMKNVNGVLYVWSGNATGGVRLSQFVGGWSYDEVWFQEDGFPPFQGAVDAEMNRVIWGSPVTYPESAVTVFAKGSRAEKSGDGVHNILKTTSSGTNGMVTALRYFQSTALNTRQPIVAWKDDTTQGIDKSSTTYATSVFRTEMYKIGHPYTIKKLRIPIVGGLTANMNATIKAIKDDSTVTDTLATITSGVVSGTNASMDGNNLKIYPTSNGKINFFVEIRSTGTDLMTVSLPVTIEVEDIQD